MSRNINEVPTEKVSAREINLLVKDWRRGRATKTLWEAIQDAYVVVLAVAISVSLIVSMLVTAQANASTCTAGGCISARTLLPYAVLAASLALAAAAARLFGPVLASAAEGFWMLDAPINRSGLLRNRLVAAVALGGAGGAALGALITATTGANGTLIGWWSLAVGLGCAAVVAFAAAEQGAEREWPVRLAQQLFSLISVATLVVVIGIAAGWFGFVATSSQELTIAYAVSGGSALLLVLSIVVALGRLNKIRRARLTAGGSLVSGMAGAMFGLDLGLARDIVVQRQCQQKGRVKPAPGRSAGLEALVWRDFRRTLRTPGVYLPVVATAVIPYAMTALGLQAFAPMVGALALFITLVPLMGGLRVITRTVGLARCLPFSGSQLRMAMLAVSAFLAAVWGAATVPAYVGFRGGSPADALPIAALTALAGLLAAGRWVAAKPIDYSAPMLATQMGAMPTGMMGNAVKGFEVLLLITAPITFGAHWGWSVGIAFFAVLFVLGFFDMDALKEQNERQLKELEEAKKQRANQR